ncbi:transmembrane-17 family protein [Carpediemonas membranifera]|uniref:Transmembrane-17 family protein n=1 Tax=Carpediemonas membranifera TaxID=201153 RepID=A0A8J6B447_9EUKA|nr:transmembrane-17 family protein [Carpediemonas membranifera]|eukprot:KAG9393919.1 transmembrane-17 family protein [Carpediemonas membranifera]
MTLAAPTILIPRYYAQLTVDISTVVALNFVVVLIVTLVSVVPSVDATDQRTIPSLFFSFLFACIWIIAEIVRLRFCAIGNKSERLPVLTFGLVISLIPQLPILLFFLVLFPLMVGWSTPMFIASLLAILADVLGMLPLYLSLRRLSMATAEVVNLLGLH